MLQNGILRLRLILRAGVIDVGRSFLSPNTLIDLCTKQLPPVYSRLLWVPTPSSPSQGDDQASSSTLMYRPTGSWYIIFTTALMGHLSNALPYSPLFVTIYSTISFNSSQNCFPWFQESGLLNVLKRTPKGIDNF